MISRKLVIGALRLPLRIPVARFPRGDDSILFHRGNGKQQKPRELCQQSEWRVGESNETCVYQKS
jgi:hypothetical protein